MISIEEAMRDYVQDVAQHLSSQTAATYEQGMRRFKEFLLSANHSPTLPVDSLQIDYAIGCARWLATENPQGRGKLAKVSLHTYFAGIKRFYKHLLQHGLIDLTIADVEQMTEAFHNVRHGSRSLPEIPPEEAIMALVVAARNVKPLPKKPRLDLARLRNIAMLEALRSSGMRVGELVKMKRDDLDHRNHAARVTGKGDKQRMVYFDDTAWQAIQEYLTARNDGERGRALYQLPIFARHDRRASNKTLSLTTDSVRLVFNQLAHDAQIEITMTPHSLRHAFATRVLEATGDLAMVQDMLGHSSPETTRIYAKVSNKKMREAHRTAFGYRGEDEKS